MTSEQIGSVLGLGALTTVAQTKNPSLFNRTINLSSGTPIVIDSSGNIQFDRPWYCAVGMDFVPGCSPSISDTAEIGSYTDIGAAMSPENVATATQQITQTYQQQCALNPESCAIARSTIPVVPAIEATTAGIVSPIICGPFSTPVLQPSGSYKCNLDLTNIPSWLLVAAAAIGAAIIFRGV
jgi:hypothetical protein